jgi:hypothetical protein
MLHNEPGPVSLSDTELDAVMAAAAPLHPIDRSAFLASVAARLRHEPEVGRGTVNRIVRELLRTGSTDSKRRLRSAALWGWRGTMGDRN